ncbi:MarR family winged helix-turn-helix transcriptional regulator [Maritalea porphyrae]|uniref:MarR family transcriptional regulator n=1 Tax=Maritalea porphyrae TaxID=880732 RepID=A0ABQ5ULC5_9HYPH|nr:MarR family transcriptional regulator [Maritalea porphyrae]GLQ16009.1 MarR family transcriptional regulator [Maritalea porphyrae]
MSVANEKLEDQPVSKQRLRLWLQMLKTTRFIENELREELRLGFQSTLPRFDVMAMLDRTREGLRMSQLSKQLMVSNGNVTGIIDRLVQEGFVMRVQVKGDKRATLVRLTPKGIEKFAEMAAEHERWINEHLKEIDETEIGHFIDILSKVREEDH